MTDILVIAPHMDDEVLGCGGTIARHIDEGKVVHVCVVCNRVYNRHHDDDEIEAEKANLLNAKALLGYSHLHFLNLPDERLYQNLQELLETLEQKIQEIRPSLVYTCHAGDLHQDHQTVAQASNIALRSISAAYIHRILAYEIPSCTEQVFPHTLPPFIPTVFVDITKQLDRKLAAMDAYKRESRPFPHPRSLEMLQAQAKTRGMQCGRAAAEAFMLLRETI